jgi:hypothetical protein
MSPVLGAKADPSAVFGEVVVPLLLEDRASQPSPTICFLPSPSMTGRSRALGRHGTGGMHVSARDLESLARRLLVEEDMDPRVVAADWLQQGLALARERRISVDLEGQFRSEKLIRAVADRFARDGYRTRMTVIAERLAEVRMSDASRRFDLALRRRDTIGEAPPADVVDVAGLVAASVSSEAIDQMTVLDRSGTVVVDEERGSARYAGAASAFEAAASARLGALRSALWLSQLRHMTRLVGELRSAPRWALEDLIELHELALTEVVPELPIPARSDTRRVQEVRLQATLSTLRESVTSGLEDSLAVGVRKPGAAPTSATQSGGSGPSR